MVPEDRRQLCLDNIWSKYWLTLKLKNLQTTKKHCSLWHNFFIILLQFPEFLLARELISAVSTSVKVYEKIMGTTNTLIRYEPPSAIKEHKLFLEIWPCWFCIILIYRLVPAQNAKKKAHDCLLVAHQNWPVNYPRYGVYRPLNYMASENLCYPLFIWGTPPFLGQNLFKKLLTIATGSAELQGSPKDTVA